jgi:hypothetical protein
MNKMLSDLKKFGLPNIKNIKMENLKTGYGETVCQLIDELVNLELYRRDFEFKNPIFPEDEINDNIYEYGDEDVNDDQFQGKNELINGIEIQTHSIKSPGGLN